MKRIVVLLFAVLQYGICNSSVAQQRVTVTYIANEGVLIGSGTSQVLIDGLHAPYYPIYQHTPDSIVTKIFAGVHPFESIDFVLVSHIHRDHFSAPMIASYLTEQNAPILFSTPQVVDSVASYLPAVFASSTERLKSFPYTSNGAIALHEDEIRIKGFKIQHGGHRWRWIQNAGHIIEMAGLKFLHVGDPSYGQKDIAIQNLPATGIDVAILPFWFLTSSEGRKVVDSDIQPKHIIAVHVSPNEASDVKQQVATYYPNAVVFTHSMERLSFSVPGN